MLVGPGGPICVSGSRLGFGSINQLQNFCYQPALPTHALTRPAVLYSISVAFARRRSPWMVAPASLCFKSLHDVLSQQEQRVALIKHWLFLPVIHSTALRSCEPTTRRLRNSAKLCQSSPSPDTLAQWSSPPLGDLMAPFMTISSGIRGLLVGCRIHAKQLAFVISP